MAEAVGVLASGIAIGTLAAQITSSVIKLKSYWDQVRDAPEDIKDLMEQIDNYNNVLAQLEEGQRQSPIRVSSWIGHHCPMLARIAKKRQTASGS